MLVHNICGNRNTPDQEALIDLANEYKKGATTDEANILIGWAKEYGIEYHKIMTHPNRSGIWSYTNHIKIANIHIPIK